ncbi:MAG TPA: 30S ribosome-binding factor RbfA [Methylomirabilota bacterium]|nr:30S ribosome-binding factor RbfA [Methylomirabilota bacterium]
MQAKRIDRINQLIKEEISEVLQRELKDPRIGFVTVTEVDVSKDLHHAKVFVSVLGSDEEWRSTIEALESAGGFIRHWLRQHIRLRYIPELAFRPDRSMAHSAHIQRLLEELKARDAHKGLSSAERSGE